MLCRKSYSTISLTLCIRKMSSTSLTKPVESVVFQKLTKDLAPTHLEIVNESYKHNVPAGSESHFKVVVVSNAFLGKSLVERHRLVNRSLAEELQSSIHALSILAKTPEQWEQDPSVHKTPSCLGGDK
jgi:stress-induced morphogen